MIAVALLLSLFAQESSRSPDADAPANDAGPATSSDADDDAGPATDSTSTSSSTTTPARASPASVGLALQPAVGLSDDERAQAEQKLVTELAALNVIVLPAAPVDPACVPDAVCVESARLRSTSPPPALLVVELVRVGPVVQLTATAAAGARRATGSHGLDETQLAAGPLLPEAVRAWARALEPPSTSVTPPPVPTQPGLQLSPMQSGALFAAGVGAVSLVAGALLVGTAEPVLEDAASSGAQKEQATTFGWIGVVSTSVGVVALGGAVGLFFADAGAFEDLPGAFEKITAGFGGSGGDKPAAKAREDGGGASGGR